MRTLSEMQCSKQNEEYRKPVVKKLLASSMGSNEKVKSNKLFCTLKISKGLIEYVQKKIKFFLSQS